jgi:hypothetical protein
VFGIINKINICIYECREKVYDSLGDKKKKKKKLTRVKSERERNEWRKRRSTECHGRTKTSATLEKKLM